VRDVHAERGRCGSGRGVDFDLLDCEIAEALRCGVCPVLTILVMLLVMVLSSVSVMAPGVL
jgi:hypothetical protein